MKLVNMAPVCERGNDLISFLYGEANELEVQDFEKHLQHCKTCKSETESFEQILGSIRTWREEALSSLASGQTSIVIDGRRSAGAAVKAFFDFAPLWMKGGLAFATVLFCLFAGLALERLRTPKTAVETVKMDARYSQEEVDKMVKEALAHKSVSPKPIPRQSAQNVAEFKPQKISGTREGKHSIQLGGSRRPLSRAEREQLAADLRLITPGDEEGLDLLGDRINQ